MELKDYLGIIRRRFLWFLIGFVLVMGGYFVLHGRVVQHYRATAQIQIALESDTRLSQIAATYPVQQPYLTFRTRADQIRSEEVMRTALKLYRLFYKDTTQPAPLKWDTMTLDDVERAFATSTPDTAPPSDTRPAIGVDDKREREKEEIRSLSSRTEILTGPEGSQTVTVTVTDEAEDPARWWASCIARAAELTNEKTSLAVVDSIRQTVEKARDSAMDRVRAAQAKAGDSREVIDKLRMERNSAAAAVDRTTQEFEALKIRRERVTREIQVSTKEYSYGGAFYAANQPVTANTLSLYQQRHQQINDLEQQMMDRGRVVRPDHPDMVSLRERKAFLEQDLNRVLVRQHEFDIATRLQEERELSYDLAILEQRLVDRRRELKQKDDELKRVAPEWDRAEAAQREVAAHDARLHELDASREAIKKTNSVRVHEYPGRARPFTPGRQQSLPIWLLIAISIGAGTAYVREYVDTSISTEYDIRRHLNLPVIGLVPELGGGEETILTRVPVRSPLSEIFNTAATILRTAMLEGGMKTLVITSANPREGKTTVAINLAIALARKGLRVVLVDTDLRLPQIHSWLGVGNTVGVSSLVEGRLQAMEALGEATGQPPAKPADYLQTTEVPNLFIVPSGPIPGSPIHVIESKAMKDLIEEMRNHADLVIFDSPPICTVSDALSLATVTDATLFVVGANYCERREASWAKHLLSNVQARVLGVLLNRTRLGHGVEYYYYYGYYGYTERSRGRRKAVRARR